MDCIQQFKHKACEYYRDHIYDTQLSYKAIDDFADKLIAMIPEELSTDDVIYCARWVNDLLKLA